MAHVTLTASSVMF